MKTTLFGTVARNKKNIIAREHAIAILTFCWIGEFYVRILRWIFFYWILSYSYVGIPVVAYMLDILGFYA